MVKDFEFGIDIQRISEKWFFDNVVKFLKGENDDCSSFDELKPLFDKYGYEETKGAILDYDAKYKTKPEIETRPATENAEEVR
jgi:hypothetical protein